MLVDSHFENAFHTFGRCHTEVLSHRVLNYYKRSHTLILKLCEICYQVCTTRKCSVVIRRLRNISFESILNCLGDRNHYVRFFCEK